LAFCNKAVEIGILYKPTSTSFDYASNKGGWYQWVKKKWI
jgi:hypothetical protein